MASDAVCVFPGMSPATISVTPKSPTARAKASMSAAAMPRVASGSCTVKNARSCVAPSVRAARISVGSVCSSAARTLFTTSGSAPMVAATTAPVSVKTIELPVSASKAWPSDAAPPEHDEHVVAEHRRRHDHRRGEDDVDEIAPREAIVREQRGHARCR